MVTENVSPAAPGTEPAVRYYWVILGTSFILCMAAMGFGRYAFPMLLPSMQDSLGVTYAPMGVLSAVNLIGYLTFSLGSGMLATRYGTKLIATASMILVGLSMIGLGLSQTYWADFGLLLLAGMGTAGVFTPIAGLGRAWTPRNMGGFTMGLLTMGVTAGSLLAAYMIPRLLAGNQQDGWRHAWIYMGIASLAVTVLGALALKEKPGSSRATGASPLAWGVLFRNRTILGICIAYFLFGFYQVYATFFVAYLRKGLNLPTELVGNIWFYWAVLAFISMIFWGSISDRIGRKWSLAACLIPVVISTVIPIFFQDLPFLYASAMLYGASFAAPVAIILAAAAESVPLPMAAAAVGLVTACFGVGQVLSPTIAGYLTDLTGSFYPGFAMSAMVIALALLTFTLWPLKRAD